MEEYCYRRGKTLSRLAFYTWVYWGLPHSHTPRELLLVWSWYNSLVFVILHTKFQLFTTPRNGLKNMRLSAKVLASPYTRERVQSWGGGECRKANQTNLRTFLSLEPYERVRGGGWVRKPNFVFSLKPNLKKRNVYCIHKDQVESWSTNLEGQV